MGPGSWGRGQDSEFYNYSRVSGGPTLGGTTSNPTSRSIVSLYLDPKGTHDSHRGRVETVAFRHIQVVERPPETRVHTRLNLTGKMVCKPSRGRRSQIPGVPSLLRPLIL